MTARVGMAIIDRGSLIGIGELVVVEGRRRGGRREEGMMRAMRYG